MMRWVILVLALLVAGGALAQDSVLLDWNDSTEGDLASYTLYRGYSVAGLAAFVEGLTSSTYTDNTVNGDSTYVYAVTAIDDSDNESTQSDTTMAYVTGTAPATPTTFAAEA